MSGPDWCRFYPGKWLTGTFGLSNEQRGVYIQIVAILMDRGECPADYRYLARVCNLRSHCVKRIVGELIEAGKIVETGSKLHQNRAETERQLALNLTATQRLKALKGWQTKRLADANWQSQPQPQPQPYSSESYTTLVESSHTNENYTGVLGGAPNGAHHSTDVLPIIKQDAKKRGTRLPEDWTLNEEGRAWCREALEFSERLTNETEEEFKDWGLSVTGANSVKMNWNRAFKNWARRKHERLRAEERREQQYRDRFQASRR